MIEWEKKYHKNWSQWTSQIRIFFWVYVWKVWLWLWLWLWLWAVVWLIERCSKEADGEDDLKQFAELKELNKKDSEIYRNYLAERGIEKTPSEVREHFATIEYGLEIVSKNKGTSQEN